MFFLSERNEKAIPCRGAENRKGKGTNRGKPGLRSLEAESIRSSAENMEGSGVVLKTEIIIIIIMYIYHVLMSAHMIHINLNTIFYTHLEHSPTIIVYIRYHMETHTHTQARARARTHTHTHTHTQ